MELLKNILKTICFRKIYRIPERSTVMSDLNVFSFFPTWRCAQFMLQFLWITGHRYVMLIKKGVFVFLPKRFDEEHIDKTIFVSNKDNVTRFYPRTQEGN